MGVRIEERSYISLYGQRVNNPFSYKPAPNLAEQSAQASLQCW